MSVVLYHCAYRRGTEVAAAHRALWLSVRLALAAAVVAFQLDGALASLVIHPFGPLFIAGGLFYLVFDGEWCPRRVAAIAVCLALSLGALAYPLYLLHDVGRVLFVSAAAALPGGLEVVLGIVFSLGLSLAVARLSGRFVKPPLRAAISAILGPDRRVAVDRATP